MSVIISIGTTTSPSGLTAYTHSPFGSITAALVAYPVPTVAMIESAGEISGTRTVNGIVLDILPHTSTLSAPVTAASGKITLR